jgi:hypothetical protein
MIYVEHGNLFDIGQDARSIRKDLQGLGRGGTRKNTRMDVVQGEPDAQLQNVCESFR